MSEFQKDFTPLKMPNKTPVVYLDSSATSLTPKCVIQVLENFYSHQKSNIHRGQHLLSEQATTLFEQTREKVRNFIQAKSTKEIIFTQGTTDSINFVAQGLESFFQSGDEIIISEAEHHANFVPWQMLAERKSLKLKIIPVDKKGHLIFSEFEKLISSKTKFMALNYASNSLGIINPVEDYLSTCRKKGILTLIDAAQAVPHFAVNVKDLGCDYLAFSSHKMMGPLGVGILYGKEESLNKLRPFRYGGAAVGEVTREKTTLLDLPHKFEPGTPCISGVIGLGAAIDYLQNIGFEKIKTYEDMISKKALEELSQVEGLEWIGDVSQSNRVPILSFQMKGHHHYDVSQMLSEQGFALRAGHHCTQPLFNSLGLKGSIRISFSIYNTLEDVIKLKRALEKTMEILK